MSIKEKLKKFIENENTDLPFTLKIIVIGLLGFVLLFAGDIFSLFSSQKKVEVIEPPAVQSSPQNYRQELAAELEEIISLISGVGEVKVQIRTEQEKSYEYEYKISEENKITNETDHNDGQRKIEEYRLEREVIMKRDGSGNQEPIVKVKKYPPVRGVIIVAQGAEDSNTAYKIYQAVSSFLDLPMYKINVLPHERS